MTAETDHDHFEVSPKLSLSLKINDHGPGSFPRSSTEPPIGIEPMTYSLRVPFTILQDPPGTIETAGQGTFGGLAGGQRRNLDCPRNCPPRGRVMEAKK